MVDEFQLGDLSQYFEEAYNQGVPFWAALEMLIKLYPECNREELIEQCLQHEYSLTKINYAITSN